MNNPTRLLGTRTLFLLTLIMLVLGPIHASYAANAGVPVVILPSSHPGSALLQQDTVRQIVRDNILSPSPISYIIAKVRVIFDNTNNPAFLIVYLALSDISLSETTRIHLGPNYSVLAVETNYQQQESDLEPGFFAAHDVDMMFDTSVDFIPTAVAGVNRACDIATQAGYACDRLFGSQASVQDVRNYLLSNRVKAVGNIGHGNPTGIALDDGDLTAAWFDTLPETALNNKVIYFNSCQVHNPPLETAVMGAGARTFIGGLVNLPIGPSEDVFKCFWQDILLNQSEMGIAVAACETAEGLIGFHGLSGDPGQFSGSLVGDKDNFVAGDTVDTPPRSQRVLDLLNFIAADPGQGPGVDLDQGGANRPVGLTHYFAIPPQALITSAKVKFRAKSNDPLVYNDGVYYNDTVQASPLLPVIVLRDLLGREPHAGDVLDLEINLGKVPVRTMDTTGGPGGHWSAQPDAFQDLLNILTRDNQLDLVFSDDLTVDYSELTVTFVLPTAPPGDLTGDTMVNQNDLNIILAALNTPAYSPNDPRDLDHDGRITVLDARKLVLLCSKPRCAIQ